MKSARKHTGIVDQVRTAFSRDHRLATVVGILLGAIVPLATFTVAHNEVDWAQPLNPAVAFVVGGLVYSARTVYDWGRLAFVSAPKAVGFTVLLEGSMVASQTGWLSIAALVYLCAINAIATGVTLARGSMPKPEAAAPADLVSNVPAVRRRKPATPITMVR